MRCQIAPKAGSSRGNTFNPRLGCYRHETQRKDWLVLEDTSHASGSTRKLQWFHARLKAGYCWTDHMT